MLIWLDYICEIGNSGVDRDDFDDVIDFMVWFVYKIYKVNGILKWDVYV